MKPYYRDDYVTLYHGDCLEVTDWLSADVLVTDPPYGIAYGPMPTGRGKAPRGLSATYRPIANDTTFEAATNALARWGRRSMAVFAGQESLAVTLSAVAKYSTRQRVAVWHKTNRTGALGAVWLNDAEFIVFGVDKLCDQSASAVINTRADVGNPDWQKRRPDAFLHPTQKAVSGMERVIAACPPGVIADPFAGSGSTLLAARLAGRGAIGVELEERYCEVAAKRLAQDVFDFTDQRCGVGDVVQ